MIRLGYHILFKREQNSKRERGFAIGPDFGEATIIIDKDMKVVDTPIWTFHELTAEGVMRIEL